MNKLIKYCKKSLILINKKNNIYLLEARKLLRLMKKPENLLFNDNTSGDIQRNIDDDHLNNLIEYQNKYYKENDVYSFPNPIVLCCLNNKLAIIDGQHRLKCIEKLYNDNKDINFNVLVSVITINNENEYDEYFVAINKNKPVQLYKNVNDWKFVIKKIEQYMTGKWHMYMKNTDNPQIPHINIDKMKEYMDNNNVIRRIGMDADRIIEEIEELNNYYKYNIKNNKYLKNIHKNIEKCISKNEEEPLYFGLYRNFEWIETIVYKITENVDYKDMEHIPLNYRIRIPKKLRINLWKSYFDTSMIGKCYTCLEDIEFSDFECGHVKPVFYGGTTNLDNLRPICRICNNDMGITNMDDYMKKL